MTPRNRQYQRLCAISSIAILCFVLILQFFGESEHKALAVLIALFFWAVAMLTMVLSVPRYLLHLFRDRFRLFANKIKNEGD
jgi:ABC-type nitrate/sulfonate/bicarbonate transport system permease component